MDQAVIQKKIANLNGELIIWASLNKIFGEDFRLSHAFATFQRDIILIIH